MEPMPYGWRRIRKKYHIAIATHLYFIYNQKAFYIYIINSEKYSSGRRGAPAKGVGRESVARVQIPPSPPSNKPFLSATTKEVYLIFGGHEITKNYGKMLTFIILCDIIIGGH